MLRYRGKKIKEAVQKLDSFPKVPEDLKHSSGTGGIISLFMFSLTLWLVLSEVSYYREFRIYNMFVPDVEFDEKLKINIDITVAALCNEIGADIVDVTNQEAKQFGSLSKEDTWFELDSNQDAHFQEVRRINNYLREKYHSLRNIIWKTGYMSYYTDMPERSDNNRDEPYDACRIRGELDLNKVAGNFHITAGHSVIIPGGHLHIPHLFGGFTNLSHRIDQFSFGNPSPGIIHPLDGSMKITQNGAFANAEHVYKYFIEVVPTDVDTSNIQIKTYQYSVKELIRPVDTTKGTHEFSGIFFKYDMNPLKVIIREEEYTLFQLIVRICGCIGGLYIVSGSVKHILESILNRFLRSAEIYSIPIAEDSDNTAHLEKHNL